MTDISQAFAMRTKHDAKSYKNSTNEYELAATKYKIFHNVNVTHCICSHISIHSTEKKKLLKFIVQLLDIQIQIRAWRTEFFSPIEFRTQRIRLRSQRAQNQNHFY